MGKIVKYCSSCDEGFAEKFGFCPNCAAPLQAFEMNPLGKEDAADNAVIEMPAAVEEKAPDTISVSAADAVLEIPDETVHDEVYEAPATAAFLADEPIEVVNADVRDEEPAKTEPSWTAPATTPAYAESYAGTGFHNYDPGVVSKEDDGGYYVTVIQEKNGKQRNLLLLGSLIFMVTLAFGSYIISLFQKDLFVGAIGDERSLAYLLDEVPIVEEKEELKKNEDKGGGGGGGGKNDPKPVNQGDPPDQTPDPIRPPDPKIPKLSNPDLVLPPPSTQGNLKTEKKYGQWGDPTSRFGDLSSGPGSGGGMGTGVGTGAGSGRGTGMGSGTGSGAGSGYGDGYGDGTGGGRGTGGEPPPSMVGKSSAVRIISKPQAKYNDEGRTAGVQGSVRLKVTLLANGSVGSITPVTRLPHGLTEQAIAAARLIKFEPKMQNGIKVPVTVTIDYTFSIY